MNQATPQCAERPRYRLVAKAAFCSVSVERRGQMIPLADVLLDPDEQPILSRFDGPFAPATGHADKVEREPLIIEFDGPPNHAMEPLNAAAEEMFERHNVGPYVDPVETLTI